MQDIETIFEGRLLTVTRESVRLPDGNEAHYEIIRHPGAVAIVPMLEDELVVLLRQFRYSTKETIWEIPAGTLQAGESPEACTRRELVEETGYRSGQLIKLAEFYTSPGYCDERMTLFRATELEKTSQGLEEGDILEVEAVPLGRAIGMIWRGEIRDAKTIIALLVLEVQD